MVKKFVFITFLVILFAGCNSNELDFDNIQLPTANGTFNFPLGTAAYTIRDLILNQEDSLLDFQVDEDSLITLLYFEEIAYNSDTDFIQIQDISKSSSVDLTGIGGPIAGPGTVPSVPPLTQNYNFAFEPDDPSDVLDSLFYASGEVTVNVTSDIEGALDYSFTLNNFVRKDNETPLAISGTLNGTGASTTSTPTPTDLSEYKAILSGTGNMFTTDFTGTITLGAGDTFIGDESLTFDITFANQTFSIIYGKFGRDTVQVGNETLNIEFFREMGEEGIIFGNPTMRFFFENSFGIPIGVDFSGLFGDDGLGGTQTFLSGNIVDNIPVIASGDINNPGPSVRDTIEINSGNSSIVDLLATSPGRLGFNVAAISNPEDTTAINFITTTNQITSKIEIEIPLEVKLENLEQSINLSLGDGFDTSDLDSAELRIVTRNEFPFSGILAIDIQDADSTSLFMVTDNFVLEAPFINIDGLVTDANGRTEDIPLSPAGVEALSTGSHIVMTVTLNTPGSLNSRDIFVKILADYRLEISLGVKGTINVDL
ncbi:MAG: hypothetical protein ABJG78_16265 [Cyclobacteriaceae bacterium]